MRVCPLSSEVGIYPLRLGPTLHLIGLLEMLMTRYFFLTVMRVCAAKPTEIRGLIPSGAKTMCTWIHSHTHTYTHIHTHTLTQPLTLTHILTDIKAYMRTCGNTHMHSHARNHRYKDSCIHPCTHFNTHQCYYSSDIFVRFCF